MLLTRMNEEVTLLKLRFLRLDTLVLLRNTRKDPWKLLRENNTNVRLQLFTTLLTLKLERRLLKRNAPKFRTATPPRLKLIRLPVKLKPEKKESLRSLFAIFTITPCVR
ncbi:hypothetical protein UB51_00990 [Paenibacillus sp. IHBB 10380]|nr:hypothetical protein UB51_00990 [Paenibacillus sp. IHBB 10380]